jgi:hypothetical protein
MRRDIYTNCFARDFRDQGAEVFGSQLPASGRRDPEPELFDVATAQDRAVRFDVTVHCVGDELRYLTFIDAVGLRVIGWNVEPPPAIDEGSAHRLSASFAHSGRA